MLLALFLLSPLSAWTFLSTAASSAQKRLPLPTLALNLPRQHAFVKGNAENVRMRCITEIGLFCAPRLPKAPKGSQKAFLFLQILVNSGKGKKVRVPVLERRKEASKGKGR